MPRCRGEDAFSRAGRWRPGPADRGTAGRNFEISAHHFVSHRSGEGKCSGHGRPETKRQTQAHDDGADEGEADERPATFEASRFGRWILPLDWLELEQTRAAGRTAGSTRADVYEVAVRAGFDRVPQGFPGSSWRAGRRLLAGSLSHGGCMRVGIAQQGAVRCRSLERRCGAHLRDRAGRAAHGHPRCSRRIHF